MKQHTTQFSIKKRAGAATRRSNDQGRSVFTRNSSDRKERQKQDLQIKGFATCLQLWYEKNFRKFIPLELIVSQIAPFIRMECGDDVTTYPKWFKFQLANNFSIVMNQERPTAGSTLWKEHMIQSFFPSYARYFISTRIQEDRPRKVITFWDLMQCKSQSSMVPRSMIQEAYEKHAKVMGTKPKPISAELENSLKEFIKPWVSEVVKCYEDRTKMPTDHATATTRRSEGGTRFDLTSHVRYRDFLSHKTNPEIRMDPIVIHLQGEPGIGKSRLVSELCKKIGEKFGYVGDISTYTYSRSASIKHWDGYRQQLITVIDDFAFENPDLGLSDSVAEVIGLCSNVDYVVPMAHLNHKGMKFTSPFLILTSNLGASHIQLKNFACPEAYIRRICPYYSISGTRSSMTMNIINYEFEWGTVRFNQENSTTFTGKSTICKRIVDDSIAKYIVRSDSMKEYSWNQVISSRQGDQMSLNFSSEPPSTISSAVAFAIPEPLKVRMITKPQSQSYSLKPLQLAMFKALRKWKCFEPCWDPEYNLEQLGRFSKEKLFLSGDYTAATDELNFFVSQVVIQDLAEAFEIPLPHLSKWIRWEGGHHRLCYPEWTGIPDVVQLNGQLMGSLLSFPILCIINAYTMVKATKTSLDTVPALFHGDDIAAYVTEEQYKNWISVTEEVGLQLSVGKNYLSRDFVSIDSQLFTRRNISHEIGQDMIKNKTGKYALVRRNEYDSLTVHHALQNGFTTKQIVRNCRAALEKTPQSLDVSYHYGGLGLVNSNVTLKDKIIYLGMLRAKSRVDSMGEGLYSIPKDVANILKLKSTNGTIGEYCPDPYEKAPSRLWRNVRTLLRFHEKSLQFQNQVKDLDLELSRPISSIKKVIVRCVDYDQGSLQSLSDSILGCSLFGQYSVFTKGDTLRYPIGDHARDVTQLSALTPFGKEAGKLANLNKFQISGRLNRLPKKSPLSIES